MFVDILNKINEDPIGANSDQSQVQISQFFINSTYYILWIPHK